MAGKAEDSDGEQGSRWRVAAWAAAGLLLLAPLVAMQFTDEVNWTVGDFVVFGVLLFGSLGAYELARRMTGNTAYRAGVGLAIAAAFLLVWVNGAVGITDSDADFAFFLVPTVGIIGATIARFKPRGMVRAMFATAFALTFVSAIALIAGIVPAYNSALEILGITGFFVALFVGSALLFREAVRGRVERGAA